MASGEPRARVLVVGTGAVGGYFGARLAAAGTAVTFLARGATRDALRAHGVEIRSEMHDDLRLPRVDVRDDPSPGPWDIVLVCVKTHQTVAAVRNLRSALAPEAIVLALQNGVDAEAVLEQELGLPPLLGTVCFVGAEAVSPGVIHHVSGGRLLIGEPDGAPSRRLERVVSLFESARIETSVPDDIRRARWQKLAWNVAFNVVAAVTGSTVGEILAHPPGRELVTRVMTEVEAVAAAEGVTFEERYVERVLRHTAKHLGRVRPSTLQDRDRGRALEHESLTGAVVRRGAARGVATPVCQTLDALACIIGARRSE